MVIKSYKLYDTMVTMLVTKLYITIVTMVIVIAIIDIYIYNELSYGLY